MNLTRWAVVPAAIGGYVAGALAATASTYLVVLSATALLAGTPRPSDRAPRSRLLVVVPAHDEERLLGRCLDSLASQDYPDGLVRVVVVADNCTDSTPAVALRHGAEVIERRAPDHPGKGRALRWAMDLLLTEDPGADALVVVDADSVADPRLLHELALAHEAGAAVVQADYSALTDPGPRGELRAAAFLLFHRVRFRGRRACGLPCGLVGNGMLFSRDVLVRHPWNAFSAVEDLEYGLYLRLVGVRPSYAEAARVVAPVAAAGTAAGTQRRRWEGGRLEVTRRALPRLARRSWLDRRVDLWDVGLDLMVPPLGVLAIGAAAGAALTVPLHMTGRVRALPAALWSAAVIGVPVHVLLGLVATSAPPSTYRALVGAPRLVAAEMSARLRVLASRGETAWRRTERDPSS